MLVDSKEKVREAYRVCFTTEEGRWVLTDILNDCGFFDLDDKESASDIARINVGKKILGKAGIWDEKYRRKIVDTFLDFPMPIRKKDA